MREDLQRDSGRVGRGFLIGGLLLLGMTGQLWGGEGRWTALGATVGGSVNVVAVDPADPQRLFAGTAKAGLFGSSDGGRSWQPVQGLPRQAFVRVLVFDPRRPQTIYVGL